MSGAAPEPAARASAAAPVERRIVSVLFADLVGFTPLSERLDPEDVATIQDAYFGATRETIERYGGVVEKFIGDAVMAVFGAPRSRDDDAERAVRAGLALIGAVEQLGARLGLEPGELKLRVGVNSGEVVHATAGPDAGRVTGDTVNTAARLQAAAHPGTVLLGELTALAVAETIETRVVPPVELKGKADPVHCAEAVGPRAEPSREEALGTLRAPMLGRDLELRRLGEAVADGGRARVARRLLVVAPPGVGKSRLLAELAASESAVVLRARVRPQGTAPYETVAQLVASAGTADLPAALAAAGVAGTRAAVVVREVDRLVAGGADQPGSGSTAGDLATEREARFDAWIAAIDALAGGPAAWLVEDVHWAGGDLLAFLDRAGRVATRHGRTIVATTRPSLLDAHPGWCAVGAADRLDLEPLPAADAEALVRALVGEAIPPHLVGSIVARSDGTPLFIEELLRTWASVGTLVPTDAGWRLAVAPEAVPLPPTVQAIYAAQLDDLPPDARLIARRGAVAGRRVPIDALTALDIPNADGLDRLRRRALIAGPVHDPVTGEAFAYRHALLRDAGYASLARAERAHLHVAMARWLAEVAGERSDVVAEAVADHHAAALDSLSALTSGTLPPREALAAEASTWYERAANVALRLAAHEACCRLLERSINLSGETAGPDLARRRRRLGEVLAASANLDAGIAALEAALACCPDDAESVAASAYGLGRAYMQQMRFVEAERLAADSLTRAGDAPGSLRARLHALHAWAIAAQGRTDGVVEEAGLAEALVRGGDPIHEVEVLEHTSTARDEVGAAAEVHWAELERRARAAGAWQQVVVAARIRAAYRAETDPAAAIAALAEAAELGRAHGQVEGAGWCDYARCELLWTVGRWDEAIEAGLRTVDLAEVNGYERLAFRTYVVLLAIAAERRLPDLAERYEGWRATMASHFPATPSPYARLVGAATEAWIQAAHGRPPAAPDAALLEAIVPMSNPHVVAATEALIRAWIDAGRADLAESAAGLVVTAAADDDATPLMRASAALVSAWIGSGDPAGAVEAARAAMAPWWEARALHAGGAEAEARAIAKRLGIKD